MTGEPSLSVVLCTFRRPDGAARALASLLAQPVEDLQVVVADAGEVEDTAEALRPYEIDPRWSLVGVPDRGLCGLRNDGGRYARAPWIAFLDDDDHVGPGWAEALLSAGSDAGVGLVSCGNDMVDDRGTVTATLQPKALGPLMSDLHGNVLAGCWAARRDVLDEAGWYLPGLMWSHQTELWIRMAAVCRERGLRAEVVDRPLTRIHRRAAEDRRLGNPRLLVDGTRWILARHAAAYDRAPDELASAHRILGVNYARIGDLRSARQHFLRSLRLRPDAATVARAAATLARPLAARAWGTDAGHVDREAMARQGLAGVEAMSDEAHATDSLFLPWRYRENAPASADRDGTPFWEEGTAANDVRYQDPVYRWAARLAQDIDHLPVLDVGCGGGHKLVHRVGAVTDRFTGADQPSGIELAESTFPGRDWLAGDLEDDTFWGLLASRRARLVICSDVIEHLVEPRDLLRRLRQVAGAGGRILLSTPDRSRLEGVDPLGPPRNPRHVREWSADELALLCESAGFRVVEQRHLLPRSYSATRVDLNRTVYRLLSRRPVPDRRSSLALLLEPVVVDDAPAGPDGQPGRAAHS